MDYLEIIGDHKGVVKGVLVEELRGEEEVEELRGGGEELRGRGEELKGRGGEGEERINSIYPIR